MLTGTFPFGENLESVGRCVFHIDDKATAPVAWDVGEERDAFFKNDLNGRVPFFYGRVNVDALHVLALFDQALQLVFIKGILSNASQVQSELGGAQGGPLARIPNAFFRGRVLELKAGDRALGRESGYRREGKAPAFRFS
jgi:hypothetical protein